MQVEDVELVEGSGVDESEDVLLAKEVPANVEVHSTPREPVRGEGMQARVVARGYQNSVSSRTLRRQKLLRMQIEGGRKGVERVSSASTRAPDYRGSLVRKRRRLSPRGVLYARAHDSPLVVPRACALLQLRVDRGRQQLADTLRGVEVPRTACMRTSAKNLP